MPDVPALMDYIAGVSWEEADGLVEGLTDVLLTVTDRRTGSAILTNVAAPESASPGWYEYTIDDALLPLSLQGIKLVFTSAVRELRAEQHLTVGPVTPAMRQRRQTRHAIARRVWQDRRSWLEQATAPGGGASTTQFRLTRMVVGGRNQYRGMWARFSNEANRGLSRMVTAYDETTSLFTISPALPSAVATGHWVELYPEDPDSLDRWIDDAWSEMEGRRLRRVEEQVIETDGSTQYFQLPSDARYVYQVSSIRGQSEAALPNSCWTMAPGGQIRLLTPRQSPTPTSGQSRDLTNPMGWKLSGSTAWPDGYTMKVHLLCGQAAPLFDESWIDAPSGPFVNLATQLALAEMMERAPDARASLLGYMAGQKSSAVRRLSTQLPAGSKAVSW